MWKCDFKPRVCFLCDSHQQVSLLGVADRKKTTCSEEMLGTGGSGSIQCITRSGRLFLAEEAAWFCPEGLQGGL